MTLREAPHLITHHCKMKPLVTNLAERLIKPVIDAAGALGATREQVETLFCDYEHLCCFVLERIEILKKENTALREGLSKVATNLGNGSAVSPQASIQFLTIDLPEEVRLECTARRTTDVRLKWALEHPEWLYDLVLAHSGEDLIKAIDREIHNLGPLRPSRPLREEKDK